MIKTLQSNQVKCTPVDAIIESGILKIEPVSRSENAFILKMSKSMLNSKFGSETDGKENSSQIPSRKS